MAQKITILHCVAEPLPQHLYRDGRDPTVMRHGLAIMYRPPLPGIKFCRQSLHTDFENRVEVPRDVPWVAQ
eukprot:3076095-Pyramimonas_sp.AAC.1